MKVVIIIATIFMSIAAHADCAGNVNEKANIAGMLKKLNPFGTWEGTYDNGPMVVTLSEPNGQYKGVMSFNGSKYGPLNVKLCDYGTEYSVIVSGYEAMVEILSKTQIVMHFNGEAVKMNKK